MKITQLNIESFRGIPDKLVVDFTKNGQACSTIIYGDNGSGKSSIIDALEYNLQARIGRTTAIKNEFRPSPFNLRNDIDSIAMTRCHFSDKSENERYIYRHIDKNDKEIFKSSDGKTHTNFSIAPIALRRSDIISYTSMPVQKKQVLFWSFIYTTDAKPNEQEPKDNKLDQVVIQNLDQERIILKANRDNKREELAKVMKITLDEIPKSLSDTQQFIHKRLRGGLNKHQYRRLQKKAVIKFENEKANRIAKDLIKIHEELKENTSRLNRVSNINSGSNERKKKETRKFLSEASQHLTRSFNKISTSNFVKEINVKIGKLTEVSFEIEVVLSNGNVTTPNNIFSEANLDLLILLLYTSIILESEKYGQSKVLVLDDVLQSVDSTIRAKFINYLLDTFKDWQIIITVHDRMWKNQLISEFQRKSHSFKEIDIQRWDFESGPRLVYKDSKGCNHDLLDALKLNNIQFIASATGILLEAICDNLSVSLNTTIKRKYDDRYTIGDLWGGVKKHFKRTKISNITEDIDRLLIIRNLISAHYNEWAHSISDQEIIDFAEAVNSMYLKTHCNECVTWIDKTNRCKCGKIIIE